MSKRPKDKKTFSFHKFLHKILQNIKVIYEICKVLKKLIKLFF